MKVKNSSFLRNMIPPKYLCVLVTQLYPTLCNPMDCSLPGSSVHGILQERIPEWVAIPFPSMLNSLYYGSFFVLYTLLDLKNV